MKTSANSFIPVILAFPVLMLAATKGSANPVHKYWTCAISSYNSLVDGKYEEAQCRANTEYSDPPCRGFVVEYEGANGIRPDAPYQHRITSEPFGKTSKEQQPTMIKIEINKVENRLVYTHTLEQTGANANNKKVYKGLCTYNEAPSTEKIYMDYGLKAVR